MPKSILQEKVDSIEMNLVYLISTWIMIPFLITTLVMILIGSYVLDSIAFNITNPIVVLNEKVRDILVFRYQE